MTNFEKKMQELAQEVLKDKNVSTHMIICNAGNLPCSRCPLEDKCSSHHGRIDLDEWLREEAE